MKFYVKSVPLDFYLISAELSQIAIEVMGEACNEKIVCEKTIHILPSATSGKSRSIDFPIRGPRTTHNFKSYLRIERELDRTSIEHFQREI